MTQAGRCFIVFGVSGVGKSTTCERYAAAHQDFLYARASKLLSQATNTSPESLRRSSSGCVLENQHLLVHAVNEFRAGREDRPFLLDAHAVIDNDDDLVEVPVGVISALHPSGLILLEAKPDTILKRRRDDAKTRPTRTVAQITRELNAEREAVTRYANSLDVPLRRVQMDDQSSMDEAMSALMRHAGR